MSPSSRYRWLWRAELACIVTASINLLWGIAMLAVHPGWQTAVSWTAATAAIAAATYAHHVRRGLLDVQ